MDCKKCRFSAVCLVVPKSFRVGGYQKWDISKTARCVNCGRSWCTIENLLDDVIQLEVLRLRSCPTRMIPKEVAVHQGDISPVCPLCAYKDDLSGVDSVWIEYVSYGGKCGMLHVSTKSEDEDLRSLRYRVIEKGGMRYGY